MINVAKAFIKKNDKFLLVLRSSTEIFPNTWEFPGGRTEEDEVVHEALEREVLEETNLRIKIGDLFDCFVLNYKNTDYKFHIFKAEIISGSVVLSHEHTDYKWVTKEKALNMNIKDYTGDFLRNLAID